jgi:hypothetical protein
VDAQLVVGRAMGLALGVIMQVPLGWKMVEPRARAWASMS